MTVNRVILLGNLGADAELTYTPTQMPVVKFSLATTEKWKNRDGVAQEKTEWHKIEYISKSGDRVHPYLLKGTKVYLEGKVQNISFDNEAGEKIRYTQIKTFSIQLLGKATAQSRPVDTTPSQQIEPPQTRFDMDIKAKDIQINPSFTTDDLPF